MEFNRINMEELDSELIEFRRERHQYPENGWNEFLTSSKIIQKMEQLGIPCLYGPEIHTKSERYGVPSDEELEANMTRAIQEGADPQLVGKMRGGYTGVVAVLDTGRPGPVTAMRFDIDCNDVGESASPEHLPVKEGFASVHENLMHACGHDAHTAIGIGVAAILAQYKDQLGGVIKLFFQPAEEGTRGAASMADSGLLDDVDYLYGAHVGGPSGLMAASTSGFSFSYKVDLIFKGVAAHAGQTPEEGKNALAAAANAIINLLAISRSSKGWSRINVGVCEGGTGRNVIPDHAVLKAEVRGENEEINEYLFHQMLTVAKACADMYQCTVEHKIMGGCVDAVMDEELAKIAVAAANETDGFKQALPLVEFAGGGEDVTYMVRRVQEHGGKATYMVMGASQTAPNHSCTFDIDETVIGRSARLFSTMVMKLNGSKVE